MKMEITGKGKRGKLIALVHIAKCKALVCPKCGSINFGISECPQCGRKLSHMPDFWYRDILEAVTGFDTCSRIDEEGLEKIMKVFNEAGFREANPYINPTNEQVKQNKAVRRNIYLRAEEVLGENWQARLTGFVRSSFNKESLAFCNAHELRKVIGWINRTGKSQKGEEV